MKTGFLATQLNSSYCFFQSILCCDKGILYRLAHIGVGGACGVAVLVTIFLKESHMIQFMKDQYRKTRHKRD